MPADPAASPVADEAPRVVYDFTAPGDLLAAAEAVAAGASPPSREQLIDARALGEASRALPPDEVRESLTRMLPGRDVHAALQLWHDCGLLKVWLPELEATVDFSQEAGRRHKDVWEHTKQVVRQAVPRPDVRWAALLHDIGKVPTRTFTPAGGVHFHRHSEAGARMFEDVHRRLRIDRAWRQKIRFLILHHLRANQYQAGWTDSAVRRFDREMGGQLVDLLDLSRADITSRRPGKRQAALEGISELARRISEIRAVDAVTPPLPTGIGSAMMEGFGLPPSRRIGELKEALSAAVEAGEIEGHQPSEYYLPYVAKLLGVAYTAPAPPEDPAVSEPDPDPESEGGPEDDPERDTGCC